MRGARPEASAPAQGSASERLQAEIKRRQLDGDMRQVRGLQACWATGRRC